MHDFIITEVIITFHNLRLTKTKSFYDNMTFL